MAAYVNSTVLIQAAAPVKDFASSTSNSRSIHVGRVVQPRPRNFNFKQKSPRVTPFLSGVNHAQLLPHSFFRSSGNSLAASPAHFREGRKGTRFEGTVAMAADANGRSKVSKPSGLVVCFGEMLIDFVPTVGGVSLADAPAFKKAPGGAPANVAVGIARLGGTAAFMGKVGDDDFGYMLAKMLKENGVETRAVRFDHGARTALAFVTLTADGEREFMFYRHPSADMLLETSELDLELLRQATILHFGSISLMVEPCRSAHLAALEVAKEAGVLLSYDPNLRLPLWPSPEAALEGIKSVWNQADIIKVSEEEITFLTQGADPYSDETALKLFTPNLKLLLVTEGAGGCRYYGKNFSGRVEGLKVTVVDTTGAGDAFCAGLLSQLVHDLSLLEDEPRLREALKFANACGAIATTERGAIPALPNREMVMRLLSKVHV